MSLVSSTSEGATGSMWSDYPSMSYGGRYVSFLSPSPNFPGSNGFSQVYRKDLSTGALRLVSSTVNDEGLADLALWWLHEGDKR